MMTKTVRILLIVNVAFFLIQQLFTIETLGALYFVGHPYFMPFQFITYMFLHADFWHLFFNMFALWVFGRVIEQTWGWKRFLIYYFACGIGAGVVQEIGQFAGWISPYAMTIGASGAVYGILLAFGMLYPNEKIYIYFVLPLKAKYFVAIFALLEIVYAVFATTSGVAHLAHLGGMLVGLILILYWKNKGKKQYTKREKTTWTTTSTRPHMTAEYNKNEHSRDYQFNAEKKASNAEIDRILEKIRREGYANLTDEEKRKLFDASNK